MNSIIVYVDDAAYALQMLGCLHRPETVDGQPGRWIVVGCAPRITHRASKWVTNSARQNWQGRWADKVFAGIVPWLQKDGDVVVTIIAKSTLRSQTESLVSEYGASQVVDARRPRLSLEPQAVAAANVAQPQGYKRNGIISYAAAFLSAGMMVAD